MHVLIGALVYAGNVNEALREARRVFSKHTTYYDNEIEDEVILRFDYFVLFDPQTAIDFANLRKKTASMKIVKNTGVTDDGEIKWIESENQMNSTIDYNQRYFGHWKFQPNKDEPAQYIPAAIKVEHPHARHLIKLLMNPVRKKTLEALNDLRIMLCTYSDEELFDEKTHDTTKGYARKWDNRLTQHLRSLWTGVEYCTNLFDHLGDPLKNQGSLENYLESRSRVAIIYNKDFGSYSIRGANKKNNIAKIIKGEIPFDTLNDGGVLLNMLPMWLVCADAKS